MARLAISLIAVLALSGCAANPAVDDRRVQIVASTNVYGSIAEAVGGDSVVVTSIIESAAQDPHSYEASAQDRLSLSKADLVIANGGGYDPFIDALLDTAPESIVVVNASEASGLLEEDHESDDADDHAHIEGFNEHVWYSFHGVEHVAERLARELSQIDPDNAGSYAANLDAFVAQLETLELSADAIDADGARVAITEPVPLYLLEELGFINVTPDEFSEAIEEGTDVPPALLAETLAAIEGAAFLAYNSQTASAETEKLRAAADEAGVPVVEFTETLPDGEDYISWMTANLTAISAALS